MSEYPQYVGRVMIWACCVSIIGPACQHRSNPDGTTDPQVLHLPASR